MFPVIILCGGLGTRLRDALSDKPKVLAPVGGRPFLDYLLEHLGKQAFRDIILSTGYMGDAVAQFAGDGDKWDLEVQYARELEPLGTGGALRYAVEKYNVQTPFLALNGDTFFAGSLQRLVDFHILKLNALASIALVSVKQADRYGTVLYDSNTGSVSNFVEKRVRNVGSAWINAGVYVLEPQLFKDLTKENVSLERDIFPGIIGKGLYGCPFEETAFLDIGTPEDYSRAEAFLNRL